MIEALIFYMFSAILLVSGLMVISAKNPVHSVLFLILAFFNAAGLFVLLGAEFLAMILVIVYVGAVAVLFLFVVMMLDIKITRAKDAMTQAGGVGSLIGFILLGELLWIYKSWHASIDAGINIATPLSEADLLNNTKALGEVLYTDYIVFFQVSGVVLLVAMIGAITLTLRTRPGVRRQVIHDQVNRRPQDVVKVEKVETGAGIS